MANPPGSAEGPVRFASARPTNPDAESLQGISQQGLVAPWASAWPQPGAPSVGELGTAQHSIPTGPGQSGWPSPITMGLLHLLCGFYPPSIPCLAALICASHGALGALHKGVDTQNSQVMRTLKTLPAYRVLTPNPQYAALPGEEHSLRPDCLGSNPALTLASLRPVTSSVKWRYEQGTGGLGQLTRQHQEEELGNNSLQQMRKKTRTSEKETGRHVQGWNCPIRPSV